MESKTVKTDRILPVLPGTIVRAWWHGGELNASIECWCPYCKTTHVHGWAVAELRPSHRCAHCVDGPLAEHGYKIQPWPANMPESKAHVVKPGRKQYSPADATVPCHCGCQKRLPQNSATPVTATRAGR